MPMLRRCSGTEMPRSLSNSGRPSTVMRPVSGVSRPAMQRKVVVLPQPDGPSSVKNVPGAGNIVGANTIYAARPDGLTFGIFNTGLLYSQMAQLDGVTDGETGGLSAPTAIRDALTGSLLRL